MSIIPQRIGEPTSKLVVFCLEFLQNPFLLVLVEVNDLTWEAENKQHPIVPWGLDTELMNHVCL